MMDCSPHFLSSRSINHQNFPEELGRTANLPDQSVGQSSVRAHSQHNFRGLMLPAGCPQHTSSGRSLQTRCSLASHFQGSRTCIHSRSVRMAETLQRLHVPGGSPLKQPGQDAHRPLLTLPPGQLRTIILVHLQGLLTHRRRVQSHLVEVCVPNRETKSAIVFAVVLIRVGSGAITTR